MRDSDIDSLSADGAQESPVRQYRVDVQSDRWDPDAVRYYLFVWAQDPNEAGHLALRDFPAGRVRFVDEILRDFPAKPSGGDEAPYRRNSDPSTSYVGARDVAEREGKKRIIRPNTGRHIAAEMLLDHPEGISGLDAGKAMIRYGIGATSQDPANIGRRRLNELAEYGGADRVDNLYLPNEITRRVVNICRAGGIWEAEA